MANPIKFKVDDREFTATLRKYTQYSNRDIPTICNTKAFYIARRAVRETPMVKASQVRKQIRDLVVQKGRGVKLKMSAKHKGVPIAALIVNKRQGKIGKPGFYGAEMTKAIEKLISGRIKGIAFLKSGWLWAIKALEPYAEKIGAPRTDNRAKAFGKPKGSGTPAKQGWRVAAKILNSVTAKWDKRDLAATKAEPALQRAFDAETQSMKVYIEKKQRQAAKRAGIRTN
jgi:hypothetical protein